MESSSACWLCKLIYPTGRTPKHVWESTCNMQFPRNHRKPQKINLESQTTHVNTQDTHTAHPAHTHTPHGASRRNHMLKLHCHLCLIKTITMITMLMMKMIPWLLLLLLFCRGIQIEIWGRRGASLPLSLSLCSFTANIRKLCVFLLYCKKPPSPTPPPLIHPWLSDAAATAGILEPLFVYCVALLSFYLDFVTFFCLGRLHFVVCLFAALSLSLYICLLLLLLLLLLLFFNHAFALTFIAPADKKPKESKSRTTCTEHKTSRRRPRNNFKLLSLLFVVHLVVIVVVKHLCCRCCCATNCFCSTNTPHTHTCRDKSEHCL